MAAKNDQEHECKQKRNISTLYIMLPILITLMCITTGFAAKTISTANALDNSVNANTSALKKLDGNDRRIAEIQRDIAWMVMIMKEDREERKRMAGEYRDMVKRCEKLEDYR